MSAVKALQQWCRVRCDGYRDVSITNMTTSFRDGLAFCALIHKHRPDLIDFDSLRKDDVYENNKLAFAVAEEQLGIPALLDAEDMVALKVPDRLSILTYVSQYYNYFHGRSPIGGMGGIKRPADEPVGEPTGKKNQPVVSKVFPSSGPARENSPPPSANITRPSLSPRLTRNATKDATVEKPRQTGTLSNKCVSCNQVVHLVQRHLVDGKLYHRNCAKSLSPANPATLYRRLPTTPLPDSTKTNTTAHVPSRTGPSWLTEKPSHPAGSATSTPPSQPSSSPSRPSWSPSQPPSGPSQPAASIPTRPAASGSSRPSWSPSQPPSGPSQPAASIPTRPAASGSSRPSWSPSQPPSGPSQPAASIPTRPAASGSSRPSWSPSQTSKSPSQTSKSPSRPSKSPSRPASGPSQPAASIPTRPAASGSSRPSWSPSQPSNSPSRPSKSPSRPASSPSPAANESQTSVVSKPAAWRTAADSTFTTATTSVITNPTPAPRTSTTAAKNLQSKLKFFTSNDTAGDAEKKTTTASIVVNKGPNVSGKVQEATAGQAVTVVVNIGGLARKEADVSSNAGGERGKAVAGGGDSKAKASAAAFISKKLFEENNNNNSKPPWMNVVLKKSDQHPQVETPKKETQPAQVETPKKETGAVRGRKRLKADPTILADLQTPIDPRRTPSPVGVGGLRARTPDRGASKPGSAAPNTSASENESPADWRSKLKPIAKPAGPSQSPKLGLKGAGKPQVSEPSPSAHPPSISVTPPAAKGFLNGQKDTTANGTKSESTIPKTKPDYILKEDIMRELQEIEDSVNEWERRGVELEVKLRSSEEEGKDDAVMDELMVEWFNLIRNKQVAMRRESELVYIGRTQDLEEEQPSVENELRRLMEKPEHLKTSWDRQREEELMAKLVGIVNDRNAIVEGLDEDRLREEEEDEELNKMMMNFSLKKDKPKKKPKLFGWGKKKEG